MVIPEWILVVGNCYITVFNNEVIKITISRTLQDSLLSKLQNIRSQRSGGVGSSYFDTNQISRGSFAEFDHLVTTVTCTVLLYKITNMIITTILERFHFPYKLQNIRFQHSGGVNVRSPHFDTGQVLRCSFTQF